MNTPETKRWSILRRSLVGFGVLLTLIGLFYTEELWRGKRAWEKCKNGLIAQGVKFDWTNYVSAPVPEDQNFFGVPEMQKWFVGRGESELFKKLSYPGFNNTNRMVVAEVRIVLPGTATDSGHYLLRWDDPAASTEAARLLTNAIGPTASAPQSLQALGLMLRRPEKIRPAQIFLQCQTAPTEKDLRELLPDSILVPGPDSTNGLLKFEANGDGSYRVTLPVLAVAADYLAWSEQVEPEFAQIREALKRPYARMNGNYTDPVQFPIPNFMTVRALAQTLGARAECHFLLGQPEEALRDLTLMNDICHPVMEENKPMTLIAAMINVAVRGLYATQIAYGMRLGVWREPELLVLEKQLKQINVLPAVRQACEAERFFVWYVATTRTSTEYLNLFAGVDPNKRTNSWKSFENAVVGRLIPRGWVYQNIVVGINVEANGIASLDPSGQLVFPDKADEFKKELDALLAHSSVYNLIARRMVPNYQRACQTTAYNQTHVNQALVACALERYHLARGEYPETLGALVPQYLDEVPRDVIGGNPLHYQRAADGKFVLYSVGWNGRDNGGMHGRTSFPFTDGDWVWPD